MLKLRVNKILDNLDAINANYPGIIVSCILGAKLDYSILAIRESQAKDKINSLLGTLSSITSITPDKVTEKILQRYKQRELISTSAYGRITGLDAKHYLFPHLLNAGLINKPYKHYQLTKEGLRIGVYLTSEDGGKFIGWQKDKLDAVVAPIKEHFISNMKLKLFHITHVSNIASIVDKGLYCHNKMVKYNDISNKSVNARRNREVTSHNHNIHDHVPLFFNPKNPMLYQVMKESNEKVVIIEISKNIILKDYTVFSKGNAARRDSELTPSKLKLINFPWDKIYSQNWIEDGIVNTSIKSLTMSECLIFKHIDSEFFEAIHCKNQLMYELVSNEQSNIPIKITPELFF
ncbi:DUF4433 domain-containing protein [Oceanimonas baumannii]|uniref:DUF4433 domain-containing protein n=1 Tax=Oceanimonas baumannii TaxID=129578 RepID=UPI001D181050|nr:DUF4433 domain-containing protein [Oceanimonas baumannii]MCC4264892.1 DUF4433 domain-containing protein [Oceanimonas baumannii]